jgi:hypothetical protein
MSKDYADLEKRLRERAAMYDMRSAAVVLEAADALASLTKEMDEARGAGYREGVQQALTDYGFLLGDQVTPARHTLLNLLGVVRTKLLSSPHAHKDSNVSPASEGIRDE